MYRARGTVIILFIHLIGVTTVEAFDVESSATAPAIGQPRGFMQTCKDMLGALARCGPSGVKKAKRINGKLVCDPGDEVSAADSTKSKEVVPTIIQESEPFKLAKDVARWKSAPADVAMKSFGKFEATTDMNKASVDRARLITEHFENNRFPGWYAVRYVKNGVSMWRLMAVEGLEDHGGPFIYQVRFTLTDMMGSQITVGVERIEAISSQPVLRFKEDEIAQNKP